MRSQPARLLLAEMCARVVCSFLKQQVGSSQHPLYTAHCTPHIALLAYTYGHRRWRRVCLSISVVLRPYCCVMWQLSDPPAATISLQRCLQWRYRLGAMHAGRQGQDLMIHARRVTVENLNPFFLTSAYLVNEHPEGAVPVEHSV